MTLKNISTVLVISAALITSPIAANAQEEKTGVVSFEPSFFSQYNPLTALDIVDRVPGFKLEKQNLNDDPQKKIRGFGGAASAVLINGKRPSTKSTPIENILQRYSAEDVIRVDLIRGATGGLDSSQASVVVNVILNEREGRSPAPYNLFLHFEDSAALPGGSIAFSDSFGSTDYTLGLSLEKSDSDFGGPEIFSNFIDPDEFRDEVSFKEAKTWVGNAETETSLSNGDTLRFNTQLKVKDSRGGEISRRFPGGVIIPNLVNQNNKFDFTDAEIGGDYERDLTDTLRGKAIGLINRKFENGSFLVESNPLVGIDKSSRFTAAVHVGETIGRLEFDWNGRDKHTLQFGGEIVLNFLDSESHFVDDDGSGPVVIPLPGGTTRVEELRGEVFISDSWAFNNKLSIDTGIAVEFSEIEQTGDANLVRNFTYAKPSLALTYSPSDKTQWRARIEKEVGQLNFKQFVSAANFDDDDLDLGNPDLQPENTWVFEAAYERRFGTIGVFGITPYYNKIAEVEDLVPIGGGLFEAPGNIGDGSRWGVNVNLTTSLDYIGIKNARIDLGYEWQDSSVTDPVTGFDRPLSSERPWSYDITIRKDFPKSNSSFGMYYQDREDLTSYGVDEIVAETYNLGLSSFFEIAIGDGAKLRFEGFNLLSEGRHRYRDVYTGSRAADILEFTERRDREDDPYYQISISGTF
jgi:hypothetical protein